MPAVGINLLLQIVAAKQPKWNVNLGSAVLKPGRAQGILGENKVSTKALL